MRACAVALLFALYLPVVDALVLNVPKHRAVVRPTQLRSARFFMKSQEDKEFEEWVRQKKIASGVDPDEDFGASRRMEGSIYLVGGLITVLVPLISGIWAYQNGYLTPQ